MALALSGSERALSRRYPPGIALTVPRGIRINAWRSSLRTTFRVIGAIPPQVVSAQDSLESPRWMRTNSPFSLASFRRDTVENKVVI